MNWKYDEQSNSYSVSSGIKDSAGDTWSVYATVEHHEDECRTSDELPHWHAYLNVNRPNGDNYTHEGFINSDLDVLLDEAWNIFIETLDDGVPDDDQPD